MQFHALGPLEYRCDRYGIHWAVQGWQAWVMSPCYSKCLGRDLTLPEALAKCEEDLALQTT